MANTTPAHTRPPAVAGMFYPGERRELAQTLHAMLAAVPVRALSAPKAIIVPHAGYVYSGAVAARAYALLGPARTTVRRVVLLGPAHRVAVRGLALPAAGAFATPLGEVAVDRDAGEILRRLPQVAVSDAAHALEHSLEVHLPFLQTVLEKFTLVPLAVGHAAPEAVAEVLDALWGGAETLLVISSDLSHYHSYREAQRMDRATADAILQSRADISHEQACGATPVSALAIVAQRHGLVAELLDLRNSGDSAGGKERVVGYGAFAFFDRTNHAH